VLRRGRRQPQDASPFSCGSPSCRSLHCILVTPGQRQGHHPILASGQRRGGHVDGRGSPECGSRHGASVDRLRQGPGAAVVPGNHRRGSLLEVAGPRRAVRRQPPRRRLVTRHAEAVVAGEGRVGVRAGVVGVHGHGALVLRALGVLPLPLVRVLVPAQRLRRRETPAAVVALELAPSTAVATRARPRRRLARGGAAGPGTVAGRGGGRGGGVRRDVEAEQADGRGAGAGRGLRLGPDERELRERLDGRVREVAAAAVLRVLLAHCRLQELAPRVCWEEEEGGEGREGEGLQPTVAGVLLSCPSCGCCCGVCGRMLAWSFRSSIAVLPAKKG
jgi:hypothetical protein